MKKTFKRAGVAVLSMAMLISMGAVGAMTANAYDAGKGGLTVTSTATTITAYKVATFTSGAWTWESGLNDSVFTEELMNELTSATAPTASRMKEIADLLAADTGKGSGTSITAGSESELDAGYYLLISTGPDKLYENKLKEVKAGQNNLLDTDKASPVSVNKTITSVTDGGVVDGSNNKVATATDKSTVTYRIETDIPTYATNATVTNMHEYVIVDDYDDTFTDVSVTSVVIDGATPITLNKTETESEISGSSNKGKYYFNGADIASDNKGFTIKVNKDSILENGGKHVVVTFTAKLNADERSNYKYPNEVDFTYDNTFNATGGHNTKNSEADVYSIPLEVYKYRIDESSETPIHIPITSGDAVFNLNDGTNDYVSTGTSGSASYKFSSLKAGTYTLTETTPPAGFQKINGNIATITIAVDASGDVTVKEGNTDLSKDGIYFKREVANDPKQGLPGTGGMGTVIFTVGGAAIVLLAGAMFVVYMRRRKNEE